MRITTTTITHLHTLLHLKAVIDRLKATEQQGALTTREREVLREHLDYAYDRAAALLPFDLLYVEGQNDAQGKGGTRHAAH